MKSIRALSHKHNLYLIEDTAEAAFSHYQEKYAGTFGDVGCFSFQATKTLTMGEGGFVVTPHKRLLKKMRLIRDHGMRKNKRYWHDEIGYNFRLTNLQAALGCAQLEGIDTIIKKREIVYRYYTDELYGEHGITLQQFNPEVRPVVWAIGVKIDPEIFKGGRDYVIRALANKGIETRPGFYSFRRMPPYKAPFLSVSESLAERVITLPSFPALSKSEIHYVCRELKNLRK